ncbi:alcohol dehydrogenase catalytic domain-containing protein [Nocardioides hwasunensis]|uniref:Alcohol dehydrogenase catalytic domain-containing protein n=1 Tax=Nocardioides hwasunensis TaxID=397258 RepID=A0ABR8MLK8_9ACTN|nr:alcohol dehydrogenase catalytic domain-containing protein [Nocardioides hwasunensis]MBD3916450.1 alcohol dehydrogenase catalytic domain-containing protein [Nocardioides hwasunensis]
MRAMVVDAVRAQPEVREVPDPSAPEGGVVVRVQATGLCRSDWHAWAGHDDIAFPHVPGHELAGEVVEVGAGVTRWQPGDRVTVPFVCGCGRCEWCASGNAQVCPDQQQPGFTHWGSFAELVALHAADTNLVAVPEEVETTAAAALGCRFATAYRALVGRAQVAPGEWVCVVGAGGVGLSALMIARALGARVVAVDRHAEALEVATGLGAEHAVLADGADVAAIVADLTGGGSHVAVDAVGSEQTCSAAILGLRRRGRLAQVGLLPPVDGHPRVPMDRVIAWELDLLGSHGMAAVDYPAMMALIASGDLEQQRLVERTVDLAEASLLLPGFDRLTVAGMTIVDPAR